MDFERLFEFLAIAKHASIKKAALELGISSATLSARLIRFEEHLGTPLFIRKSDAMLLTSAGEQLLPSAGEILSSFQKLSNEMHAVQEHAYHGLRIAISGSTLPLNLGPFLDQLNLSYPDIHLEILDDSRYGILDGLQSGAVDIYFAPVMDDFAPKGLVKVPVSTSNQYIILPRSHRLADRTMVSIRELDGEQFILYPRTAEPANRNFQLRNLQDSGIRYRVYDSDTASVFYKLLVPVGKGILLRPMPMMDIPPNAVCLPITDLPHRATTCFFYDKVNPKDDVLAFARDFPKFAKEVSRREHRKAL